MLNRLIILKSTTHIPVAFVDANGPIDFTANSRVAKLRLSVQGTGVVSYTLDTDDTGEFTWTSQARGRGYWMFESDDVFTAGVYDVSVVYTDPSITPDDVLLLGEAIYTLRNPTTGVLT